MLEEAIIELKKLRTEHLRNRKRMDECANKTYCNGNMAMLEGYDVSRKNEWARVKALNIAIRLIKKEIGKV